MEFNDVRLQYKLLKLDIDGAVSDVFEDGRFILGPQMRLFEEEFAQYSGTTHGVAVASGTDALSIGLKACGIGEGDDVLVPAISAAATAMAVIAAGARPVFVDVSSDTFTMDPSSAADRKTRRTRAILPVHLYGMPARLNELSELNIPILEDAAQAHGAAGEWGKCGSFGIAAGFSFYPTKNLGGYGDGGMLVTSDESVAERAALIRNYGQRQTYSSEIVGQNSRLDELQAAILRIKLRKLDSWNNRRREIASLYRGGLKNLPVQMQVETGKSNYHLFVITSPYRDALRKHLSAQGIPTLVHYPIPLHCQTAFKEFNLGMCPNAERLSNTVLSLPIHAHMSDEDVEQVIERIAAFHRDSR
jgi:dTDP-4-amino-4,6-dideoxygalactose transaminase